MNNERKKKIVKMLLAFFNEAIINGIESGKTFFVDFFKEKGSFSLYANDMGISVSETKKGKVRLTFMYENEELTFYFQSKKELEELFKETEFYKVINTVLRKAKSVERQITEGTVFEHYEF